MDRDTSPREIERYHAMLVAAGPEGRARATVGLCSAVRALALAGIRSRHPAALDDEVQRRLAVRLYGREAAMKVYGSIPDDAE